MKAWPLLGISLVELILLSAHWFLFHTWIAFLDAPDPAVVRALGIVLLVLAFSFVPTTLLSFRVSHPLLDVAYAGACVWLGLLNFLFLAACASWLAWYAALALHLGSSAGRPWILLSLSAAAVIAVIVGAINVRRIRTRRIAVALPNLPPSWRGRRAVLMSDLHLGSINKAAFSRRIVAMTAKLAPDLVFIPGDLFDGSEADLDRLLAPFKELAAPLGIYFSTGNHEEFHATAEKIAAIKRAGIHVLKNEKIDLDGVAIAGVPFGDASSPILLQATLEKLGFAPDRPSILLNHVPNRLPIVERAGVSLQLAGHTHGGQFFPYTYLTRRIFGRFTYGLHRFGALQVYTSYGAGTWGPPIRVGTYPEIVLITFE